MFKKIGLAIAAVAMTAPRKVAHAAEGDTTNVEDDTTRSILRNHPPATPQEIGAQLISKQVEGTKYWIQTK